MRIKNGAPAYKKIDTIDRLLANLWKIFPNIIAYNKNNKLMSENNILESLRDIVLQPLFNNSDGFCSLIVNIIKVEAFTQGGFGEVGILTIDEDQEGQPVMAIAVSFKPSGGFVPYYLPVIVKRGLKDSQFEASIVTFNLIPQVKILQINDPLTEAIFGGMLGYLYDAGLNPFVSKYFGISACFGGDTKNKDNDDFSLSLITEKSDLELKKLLSPGVLANRIIKDPSILINVLFQFVYGIYISKLYLGFTHFDAQHRNVLVTYINDSIIKPDVIGKTPLSYTYHGKDMSKVKYMMMRVHNNNKRKVYIAIKNTGLLTKLIDYGVCASLLYKSKSYKFKYPLIISPTGKDIGKIGASDAVLDTLSGQDSIMNTVEIQYLILNLYEYMRKGLEDNSGRLVGDTSPSEYPTYSKYYRNILESLESFTEAFYNDENLNVFNMLSTHASMNVGVTNKNKLDWVIRDHNVGVRDEWFSDPNNNTFDEPDGLLYGLVNYCVSLGHQKNMKMNVIDDDGRMSNENITLYYLEDDIITDINRLDSTEILFLDHNLTPYQEKTDILGKYVDSQNTYNVSCTNIKNNVDEEYLVNLDKDLDNEEVCASYMTRTVDKYDPNTTLARRWLSSTIDQRFYDPKKGEFGRIVINRDFYTSYGIESYDDNFYVFAWRFNPRALNMKGKGDTKNSTPEENAQTFTYKPYQGWYDFNDIGNRKTGYMETVNVNILMFKNNGKFNMFSNIGDSLWDATLNNITFNEDIKAGFSINGGYFSVGGNISPLTEGIITEADIDEHRPIGFYYDMTDTKNSGTWLPVPKPYRSSFGFIVLGMNNRLSLYDYDEFVGKHHTVDLPIRYLLNENNKIYTTTEKVIEMSDSGDHMRIRSGNPRTKGGFNYRFATASGPILIRDGKVVFTLDKMINSELRITEMDVPLGSTNKNEKVPLYSKYRIVYKAKNSSMYTASDGEANQYYGMRHSHRLMVHNVMAWDNNNNIIFFLIEGRGFNAPGLDRVQLAHLISHFDVRDAISLDGGFSANSTIQIPDESYPRYLMSDPEKRELGVSFSFGW